MTTSMFKIPWNPLWNLWKDLTKKLDCIHWELVLLLEEAVEEAIANPFAVEYRIVGKLVNVLWGDVFVDITMNDMREFVSDNLKMKQI